MSYDQPDRHGIRGKRTPDRVRAAKYRRNIKSKLAATAGHQIWLLYADGRRAEFERAIAEAFGPAALRVLVDVTRAGVTVIARKAKR